MKDHFSVRLLKKSKLELTLPLIQFLNPDLDMAILVERLNEMRKTKYQCVGVFVGDQLVACCGYWILVKYYVGRHIEPDNMIVHPDYAGMGLGTMILGYLEEKARELGCLVFELNVYKHNQKGIDFWEKMGYTAIGHHMRKTL
jgi:GNAT superfamily N-acetyltransferase